LNFLTKVLKRRWNTKKKSTSPEKTSKKKLVVQKLDFDKKQRLNEEKKRHFEQLRALAMKKEKEKSMKKK